MVEQRNTYDLKEVLRKTQNGVETEPSTHCPPPQKKPPAPAIGNHTKIPNLIAPPSLGQTPDTAPLTPPRDRSPNSPVPLTPSHEPIPKADHFFGWIT